MLEPEAIHTSLSAAFPDAEIVARDSTGTGDHFAVAIVTPAFAGKSLVQRHQMVYQALAGLMPRIHALQLTTRTPNER